MIKHYEQHKIGMMFPPMPIDEFENLKGDIQNRGLQNDIILYENMILDGFHRYKACISSSINPTFIEYKGQEPVAYVMSLNLQRRHLTAGQKAILAEDFLPFIEDERKLIRINVSKGSVPFLKRAQSSKIVAKKFNVSDKSIQLVRKIKKEAPEIYAKVKSGAYNLNDAKRNIKTNKLTEKKIENAKISTNSVSSNPPLVKEINCIDLLNSFKDNSIDCLMTDPPFSTDVEYINEFVEIWLPLALSKVKDEGRCYICTGAYPKEIQAYLNVLLNQDKFIVDNPLIWTYRNALGITPKNKYNLNYQMIWHLYSDKSPQLDTNITNEMFSVQDINAPDGRLGNRFFKWQKPDELAERFVRHGSNKNDLIVDPFCGSGTFLIAASKAGRKSYGGDIDKQTLNIAVERGCVLI